MSCCIGSMVSPNTKISARLKSCDETYVYTTDHNDFRGFYAKFKSKHLEICDHML